MFWLFLFDRSDPKVGAGEEEVIDAPFSEAATSPVPLRLVALDDPQEALDRKRIANRKVLKDLRGSLRNPMKPLGLIF